MLKFVSRLTALLDGSLGLRRFISKELVNADNPSFTLVDVGALGEKHHRWINFPETIKMVSFDPNADGASTGTSREISPVALSEFGDVLSLNIAAKKETSSRFEANMNFLGRFSDPGRFATVSRETCETTTLRDALGKGQWFGKLDVQGMELEILRGAGESLDSLLGVEVEVEFSPVYLGQPLAGDLFSFLGERGIEFVDFLSLYSWPRRGYVGPGQLVFADALFLRPPEWVAMQGDLEISKCYLSICLVYGRYDIAGSLIDLVPGLDSAALRRILSKLSWRYSIQRMLMTGLQIVSRPILNGSTLYLSK